MATHEQQIAMYGCTVADMKMAVEDSLDFKFAGAWMVACSMLSNAQEEIERGMREHARQSINRAKWIIHTYCRPDWKPIDLDPTVPK